MHAHVQSDLRGPSSAAAVMMMMMLMLPEVSLPVSALILSTGTVLVTCTSCASSPDTDSRSTG